MCAEALSRKPGHAGALAFGRTGDPSTGDFGEAKVIRKRSSDAANSASGLHTAAANSA
jgi:hypothetical protein